MQDELTRRCRGCGRTRGIDDFAVDRSKASGRRSRCKGCSNKTNKAWKIANRDHVAAAARQRRQAKRVLAGPKRSKQDLREWGVRLEKRRADAALEELGALDGSLWLMPRNWRPHHALPSEPCDAAVDELLMQYPEEVAGCVEDADIDADGWVMPWWLRVAALPTLQMADAEASSIGEFAA